ncbi:MAG: hypothetical protein ACSHXF_11775 [Aquaticitalea sp.]
MNNLKNCTAMFRNLKKNHIHTLFFQRIRIGVVLMTIICLSSCKDSNADQALSQNESKQSLEVTAQASTEKETKKTDALCQINGEDWAYTKASGIVSTHAKTKERTAIITFKKKLDKGSESIQLTYDAETSQLIEASVQLRFPKKDGSISTCYYQLKPGLEKFNPQAVKSGTIDLSDPTVASGNAEIKNINIRHEKEKLQNPEDAVVTVSGLKFTNVGYSDIDKFVDAYTKD